MTSVYGITVINDSFTLSFVDRNAHNSLSDTTGSFGISSNLFVKNTATQNISYYW